MITDKGSYAHTHTQGNSIIGNKEGEPCAKSLMNSNPVGGYRSTMIDIPIRIITMETKEKKKSRIGKQKMFSHCKYYRLRDFVSDGEIVT